MGFISLVSQNKSRVCSLKLGCEASFRLDKSVVEMIEPGEKNHSLFARLVAEYSFVCARVGLGTLKYFLWPNLYTSDFAVLELTASILNECF